MYEEHAGAEALVMLEDKTSKIGHTGQAQCKAPTSAKNVSAKAEAGFECYLC